MAVSSWWSWWGEQIRVFTQLRKEKSNNEGSASDGWSWCGHKVEVKVEVWRREEVQTRPSVEFCSGALVPALFTALHAGTRDTCHKL